ncbi:serglycin [Melanotaenia boesemani]|uniref:serglycin n=1 Tax=Melanotaenia boesemani TaxID=1250792 RepID=UPI001C05BB78|nr:serglycin [Melanotaenia boesemani]
MKLILLLLISCLALHNGQGAPRKAVYKFVRCNPEGDQANCVTQQSPEMPWSPDLPAKLPASTAQYLEAEPVEDESPLWEEDEWEKDPEEEETPMKSEDGESPDRYQNEQGSGEYESSGTEDRYIADGPKTTEGDAGSGESLTDTVSYEEMVRSMRKLFPNGEAKPTEQDLKEDHLLKL